MGTVLSLGHVRRPELGSSDSSFGMDDGSKRLYTSAFCFGTFCPIVGALNKIQT